MKEAKEYLLNFLKQAVEADWDRLPNVVFMRHLKDQLEKQIIDLGYLSGSHETTVGTVLGNMNVNFSALGPECNEEDEEYLLELAILTAKCVWKMYENIPDDLGHDVFIKQVQEFSLSLT